MNIWSQIPFLRLLLPFLAGILTAVYSQDTLLKISGSLNFLLIILFAVIVLFILIKSLNISYKYSWVFGILVTCVLFLCGFRITILHTDKLNPNHFSKFTDESDFFYVKAAETSLEKEKSVKIAMRILAVRYKGKWVKTTGNAMCYFQKDSASKKICYGDCIVIKAKFNEIKSPQNPSEFNYKRYLSFHTIYHQAYIPLEKWKRLNINDGNKILSLSYSIRDYLLTIYRENNISGNEFAVASALVLGYDDKIDPDLISAYASSGALHVLSVSGLHVGIIYLIFNYLLFFLDKIKNGKIIKMILLLFILWFYATLTGLCPSVLRSATMFSFIVIAQTGKYNTNIFNTLAVSCFVLLLYNPYLIMEVGFLLSYLAVLGIVSIQPWIYEKWEPKTWLMKQAWLIISVSIAAQVATFPLGLLYFHQFPNYFLFSNLIVIPLSTVILGYGILMFALGKISAIGTICGKILSALVWFLNESVQIVDQIPGALVREVSINIFETWIIYAFVVFLILFIYIKQTRYIFISLILITIFLSLYTTEVHSIRKQKAIIIYNIPKASAYDFINGVQTFFYADSSFIQDKNAMLFHVQHNWWNRNITNRKLIERKRNIKTSNDHVSIKDNFIQFYNKRIVVANPFIRADLAANQKLNVDLLIVSGNPKFTLSELQKMFDFKKVIIDSSNSYWKNKQFKKDCADLKIDCYSVIDSGAYVEEI